MALFNYPSELVECLLKCRNEIQLFVFLNPVTLIGSVKKHIISHEKIKTKFRKYFATYVI